METRGWSKLIQAFPKCSVLVVGDICLDRWCRYDPAAAEASRETGIPRIGVVTSEVTPGAGGTVANNLAALGAGRVAVMGAIGQDGFGFELEQALARRKIEYRLLVASPEIQTFTYSKLINTETEVEDRPRLDFINTRPLPGYVEDQLIANFSASYSEFDVIMVADQAETAQGGVISDAFREVITDVAERNPEKFVIVDSRSRIDRFRNAIAKPNLQEANEACERLFGEIDYRRLWSVLGGRPLVITEGARGVRIVDEESETRVPALAEERPVDICGAGDSFAAGFALAFKATGDIELASRFGSLVSSVTVMKRGTGTATPPEVLSKAEERTYLA